MMTTTTTMMQTPMLSPMQAPRRTQAPTQMQVLTWMPAPTWMRRWIRRSLPLRPVPLRPAGRPRTLGVRIDGLIR